MIELLRTRRSIRKYENKAVPTDIVEILKEALLRSPSSRGINPWSFIFVNDRGILQKLAMAKEHGSSFLKGAPLAIIVCADETKSDVWVEDCSIASIIVQLTAHSLGLGTCWIQIRKRNHTRDKSSEEYTREIVGLPDHIRILSIISLGYPAEKLPPVSHEKLVFNKIQQNRYR